RIRPRCAPRWTGRSAWRGSYWYRTPVASRTASVSVCATGRPVSASRSGSVKPPEYSTHAAPTASAACASSTESPISTHSGPVRPNASRCAARCGVFDPPPIVARSHNWPGWRWWQRQRGPGRRGGFRSSPRSGAPRDERLPGQIPAQPLLLDPPVPVLLAVEQHHRYPVAVLAFEFDIGLDVELGPRLADPVERLRGHLAQVAAGPGDQRDPLTHAA